MRTWVMKGEFSQPYFCSCVLGRVRGAWACLATRRMRASATAVIAFTPRSDDCCIHCASCSQSFVRPRLRSSWSLRSLSCRYHRSALRTVSRSLRHGPRDNLPILLHGNPSRFSPLAIPCCVQQFGLSTLAQVRAKLPLCISREKTSPHASLWFLPLTGVSSPPWPLPLCLHQHPALLFQPCTTIVLQFHHQLCLQPFGTDGVISPFHALLHCSSGIPPVRSHFLI